MLRNVHLEIQKEAGGRLTVKSAGVEGHVTEHFGGKLSFTGTSARGDKGIFHASFPLFANGFQNSKLALSFAININLALSLHFQYPYVTAGNKFTNA